MKRWFGLALMMALPAVAAAPAVDISGIWTLAAEVQGVGVDETCTLAQSADGKLTGTCDVNGMAKYDTTGTVTDKTVTFHHAGTYQGTDLTMTYTGKINADGGMTGTLDVDPMAVTGSFSAKKGAPAPAAQ
jgi:hypothetical protein